MVLCIFWKFLNENLKIPIFFEKTHAITKFHFLKKVVGSSSVAQTYYSLEALIIKMHSCLVTME